MRLYVLRYRNDSTRFIIGIYVSPEQAMDSPSLSNVRWENRGVTWLGYELEHDGKYVINDWELIGGWREKLIMAFRLVKWFLSF